MKSTEASVFKHPSTSFLTSCAGYPSDCEASRTSQKAHDCQIRSVSTILRLFVNLDVFLEKNRVRNIVTRYANIGIINAHLYPYV